MIQMPLPGTVPTSTWRPPTIGSLPSWRDAKRVGIDIETCDPTLGKLQRRKGSNRGSKLGPGVRRGSYIVGVSFAIDGGPKHYVPLRHATGGNVESPERAMEYFADQAATFKGAVVGLNLAYDCDYLSEAGVDFLTGRQELVDVGVTECLINELQDAYGLDAILERRGLPGKSEEHLRAVAAAWGVNPKSEMWKLPGTDVGEYAEWDAAGPLAILRQQEVEVEASGQGRAWELEKRLTPLLIRMTRRGVRYSPERLSRVEAWARDQETLALKRVHQATGIQIKHGDTAKDKAVLPVMAYLGISLPKTPNGAPSLTAETLRNTNHPATDALLWARKMDKVQSFAFTIRAHGVRGRIHCQYNQTRREDAEGDLKGTRSGRLSATCPNLQQQFARDPLIGPMWRSLFIPEPGELWCSGDYSQQEPRLSVHYASELDLPGSDEAVNYYRDNPNADFHQMTAELTSLARKDAKAVFLGLAYGMGGAKFCRGLGLPTEIKVLKDGKRITVAGVEGQAILDRFDRRVPWLKVLAKKVERAAKDRGWIRLIMGKLTHFPTDAHGNFDWTHKAFNRLIQGGSAIQMKKAMVDADDAGYALTLSVHDELCMSVRNQQEADGLAVVMRDSFQLRVPSKVDTDVGTSWGESMVKGDDLKKVEEFYAS